jgi:hypothetical protein
MSPAIDHLLGRPSADAELKTSARDQIGCAGVFGHIQRALVAHVDHRCADLDAAGLRTDGRQQGKRRGKLAGEVMDAKIGSVRAQFLGRNGEVGGVCLPPSGSVIATRASSARTRESRSSSWRAIYCYPGLFAT